MAHRGVVDEEVARLVDLSECRSVQLPERHLFATPGERQGRAAAGGKATGAVRLGGSWLGGVEVVGGGWMYFFLGFRDLWRFHFGGFGGLGILEGWFEVVPGVIQVDSMSLQGHVNGQILSFISSWRHPPAKELSDVNAHRRAQGQRELSSLVDESRRGMSR